MQLSHHQHQSTPLPSTGNVCPALWCRNSWSADMNTLEAFHMGCQRQILDVRWWAHVSNAEMLCWSGMTSYVTCAYLCLAMLHAWTRSTSTWCSASDGGYLRRQKGNGERCDADETHQTPPAQCICKWSNLLVETGTAGTQTTADAGVNWLIDNSLPGDLMSVINTAVESCHYTRAVTSLSLHQGRDVTVTTPGPWRHCHYTRAVTSLSLHQGCDVTVTTPGPWSSSQHLGKLYCVVTKAPACEN